MPSLINNFKYLPTSSKITIITVPIAFLLLCILLVLIYILNISPSPSNIIAISDYDTLPISVPQDKRNELSTQTYYLLTEHFEVPDQSGAVSAVIRPESFEDTSEGSISTVSFIMDIDSYQQTYRAYVSWSDDGEWLPEDILIECATNDLSKYPNVPCYGMYFDSNDIALYLPFTGTINGSIEYTVKQRYYANGDPYLEVAVDSCGDQSILDQALASAKTWLTTNHLNPDDYSFEAPAHYCSGESL